MEQKKKTNKKFIIIISILVIVGVVYGGYKFIHSLSHEETDDAQIESNMNSIIPHVGGYIDKIYVTDNQIVKAGDTLFTIDQRDYLVQLEKAKANLAAAQSQVAVAESSIGSSQANANASYAQVSSTYGTVESAKIQLRRATDDYNRYKNLYDNKSITTQQYEQALAAKQEAEARLSTLQNQRKAAQSQSQAANSQNQVSEKQVGVAEANVKSAQARVDAAQLNLDYTVITAPIDGQLSSIEMQEGQFVQAGQALFYLVDTQNKWVVANFKETQLNDMKVGQKVSITVDAFSGEEFEGVITNFSPATGARFSLLPPDNATGNFVKTVQRLPVKIDFTDANDAEKLARLRSGMNVEIDVHLK
ncbi:MULTISPECIES: HlyD family secretion protein [unclassified Leeuwenhoekiella]|uniref:HlyD family secretion protein n=1 Tax=unclassified Leeuwenhoekiella TaxID=2615029 RepID=UPI000C679EE5|nr:MULTISPECIES: HlyD family secretion protein [unclassified Leeuwenhoekiella]MAW94768.1 secretion protein HlyD [Leeuwenhoekiella sp.]MAW95543.1 secretion protein HlyD [Leeuwenhoekiella sp.]MBA82191.1 secretion protein HlyD [Leeuwenhoekiella sp.]|tara:strand:- start:3988 stop:5070 length:1083 start_codon:yes stop_codon:yes gene_type:complete